MNREGIKAVRRREAAGKETAGDGGLVVTGSLGRWFCESFVRGLDGLSVVGG